MQSKHDLIAVALREFKRDEDGKFASDDSGGSSADSEATPKPSKAKDAAKSIGRGAVRGAGEEAKRATRSMTERSITRIQNAIIRSLGLD